MQSIENSDEKVIERINGVYREILSTMYILGTSNPRELVKEDVEVFYQALCRLFDLKQEYEQTFTDREALGNRISNLASTMGILADRIHAMVRSDSDRFKTRDELFINDLEKIIYVLFNAQNSPHFSLKKIYVEGVGFFGGKHGSRETEQIGGIVYLIGDASILEEVEEEKVYWVKDIRSLTTKLSESGRSLVLATNYYYETNLMPFTETSPLKIKGCDSMYCYLKNDELKKVVNKLLAYAAKNGNHINDIPETEILNNISIVPKETRKLKSETINE